jgi:hypothetical protein
MNEPKGRRTVIVLTAVLVSLGLLLGACGGDDDDENTTTSPSPPAAQGGGAPPADVASQLPPGMAECLADQGVDLEGVDIQQIFHGDAAPPEVLNACFNALHQGGAAP